MKKQFWQRLGVGLLIQAILVWLSFFVLPEPYDGLMAKAAFGFFVLYAIFLIFVPYKKSELGESDESLIKHKISTGVIVLIITLLVFFGLPLFILLFYLCGFSQDNPNSLFHYFPFKALCILIQS